MCKIAFSKRYARAHNIVVLLISIDLIFIEFLVSDLIYLSPRTLLFYEYRNLLDFLTTKHKSHRWLTHPYGN